MQALANADCPDFSSAIPILRIENVHDSDSTLEEAIPPDQLPGFDDVVGEVLEIEHETDADSLQYGMPVGKVMKYHLKNKGGATFTVLIFADLTGRALNQHTGCTVNWLAEICFE